LDSATHPILACSHASAILSLTFILSVSHTVTHLLKPFTCLLPLSTHLYTTTSFPYTLCSITHFPLFFCAFILSKRVCWGGGFHARRFKRNAHHRYTALRLNTCTHSPCAAALCGDTPAAHLASLPLNSSSLHPSCPATLHAQRFMPRAHTRHWLRPRRAARKQLYCWFYLTHARALCLRTRRRALPLGHATHLSPRCGFTSHRAGSGAHPRDGVASPRAPARCFLMHAHPTTPPPHHGALGGGRWEEGDMGGLPGEVL